MNLNIVGYLSRRDILPGKVFKANSNRVEELRVICYIHYDKQFADKINPSQKLTCIRTVNVASCGQNIQVFYHTVTNLHKAYNKTKYK